MGADIPELVATIARSLAEHPEAVTVETTSRGRRQVVRLVVAEDDLGRVIGREGKVANAIRTVIAASADGSAWSLEIGD